jgi:hypothetical protein
MGPPGHIFPLPYGPSTVFFRPEAQPDGSCKLIARGSGFGGPGFYRMVEAGDNQWQPLTQASH